MENLIIWEFIMPRMEQAGFVQGMQFRKERQYTLVLFHECAVDEQHTESRAIKQDFGKGEQLPTATGQG